jgi:hypothetical protein
MEDSHHHDEIDSDSDHFYGFTPVRRSQRTEKKRLRLIEDSNFVSYNDSVPKGY